MPTVRRASVDRASRHASLVTSTPPVAAAGDVERQVEHLVDQLESERIPRGQAFTWRPDRQHPDDGPAAVVERRRELLAALDQPLAAGWDGRSGRLRVVA